MVRKESPQSLPFELPETVEKPDRNWSVIIYWDSKVKLSACF